MPTFKVRDLMVNVMTEQDPQIAGPCRFPTYCGFPTYCQYLTIDQCPFHTLCRYHTLIGCDPITLCHFPTRYCDWRTDWCPLGSVDPCGFVSCALGSVPPWEIDPGVVQPQDLGRLKEQLREQLARLEAAEQSAAEQMKPQTVEQIDALEQKLKDGLEELATRRKELQARPKK